MAKKKSKEPARRMIGVDDFRKLVKRCNTLKKQAGDAASEMGGLISNASENKHLDKVAFSIFRRLDRMDVQKLATTLACFDFYRDIGGLDERVEDAPALDIPREEAGEKVNVVQLHAAE